MSDGKCGFGHVRMQEGLEGGCEGEGGRRGWGGGRREGDWCDVRRRSCTKLNALSAGCGVSSLSIVLRPSDGMFVGYDLPCRLGLAVSCGLDLPLWRGFWAHLEPAQRILRVRARDFNRRIPARDCPRRGVGRSIFFGQQQPHDGSSSPALLPGL